MSTINRKRTPMTRTYEGAPSKRLSAEQELKRAVLSCLLWESEYYESGEDIATRIVNLVSKVPINSAHRLAVQARDKYYLRHVPLLICVAMIKHHNGSLISDTITHVIQRPDELTEIYSIAEKILGPSFKYRKQLRIGVRNAWAKFSEEQLAKYNRDKAFTLKDVVFLSHPPEHGPIGKIINGELKTPDTWEVALSSGSDKKSTWERLLKEKKLGGLALLRNLRNMVQVDVDHALIKESILSHKFNKVLPFRFTAAARHAPMFEPELERAMLRKCAEFKPLTGKTAVLIDHSYSMRQRLSDRSDLTRFDAGATLSVILREICEDVRVFAFSELMVEVAPRHGFALIDAIDNCVSWGGTYLGNAVNTLNSMGFDQIIVFTDEQSHDQVPGPKTHGISYMINVASYNRSVSYGKWLSINGFSESIINYILEVDNEGL